ncbi:MAG: hypothetical protein OQK98_10470 [Gammaproteobacteria bacterium]|nr:hypothetical protein [Gammaproteobacteria bacterium]
MVRRIIILLIIMVMPFVIYAEDKIELRTTTIKGNKELPKILYVVPWKDIKTSKKAERKLVLHSLFGDLFDPVLPRQNK